MIAPVVVVVAAVVAAVVEGGNVGSVDKRLLLEINGDGGFGMSKKDGNAFQMSLLRCSALTNCDSSKWSAQRRQFLYR